MAAKKFIRNVSGRLTEVAGVVTSAGAGNDGDIPALDSSGKLDSSMMPVGITADTVIAPSSENLAAGDWVNLWSDGGTLKVRKADATTAGKEADGFVSVTVTSPANATVFREGTNSNATSLTLGAFHYLGTTPGAETATAPSAAGNVVQRLGKAKSATELLVAFGEPITCV